MSDGLKIRPTETMVSKCRSSVTIDCEDDESADAVFEWLLQLLDKMAESETPLRIVRQPE